MYLILTIKIIYLAKITRFDLIDINVCCTMPHEYLTHIITFFASTFLIYLFLNNNIDGCATIKLFYIFLGIENKIKKSFLLGLKKKLKQLFRLDDFFRQKQNF